MAAVESANIFEQDVPSLSASLEDFALERANASAYNARSRLDGLRASSRWSVPSVDDEQSESEPESDGPWAPPAWQKANNTWYRRSMLGESAMRQSASSDRDLAAERELTPSRIPLPESPRKQSPRASPEPPIELDLASPLGEVSRLPTPSRLQSPARMQSPSAEPELRTVGREATEDFITVPTTPTDRATSPDGCACSRSPAAPPTDAGLVVRFTLRGETLLRTAPFEEYLNLVSRGVKKLVSSKLSVVLTLMAAMFAWVLVQPWDLGLVPDVANAAAMAKQFEPLMYASENVIPRSRELADTSIAVEDLSESVRASNMSASSAILSQLEDLAYLLRMISEKLVSFFTNVDGDVDSYAPPELPWRPPLTLYRILSAMDWSVRELGGVSRPAAGLFDTVLQNVQTSFRRAGLLERNGEETGLGRVFKDVVGQTKQQQSRATLQRTFDHLLTVLEENVSNELARADVLFQLFERVERQFDNLHRSVAKEEDSMMMQREEFLASLWRRSVSNNLKLSKFGKNLHLLKKLRASTLANKSELKAHIQLIRSVKDQLDKTRRNLVSPMIRRAQSNSFGVEQQLSHLTGTYGSLHKLRETQKHRVLHQLWAEPKKRVTITAEGEAEEIGE